jgi:fatty acid-binding protein DegV
MTPFPNTAIVTDSTSCIPSSMKEELHISEVAYYIHKGAEVLRDLVSVKRDEFLKWLPTAEKLPTTACPGPGDYLAAYKKLADRIEVIDTLNVALCQGWIAIEAAREALADISLEGILQKIQSMIPLVHMVQTADTLKYLYMGGRVGKATQLVGSMLSLKPLISMQDGEIVTLGVARGLNNAYEKIVANIENTIGSTGKIKVAYMHAGAIEHVEKLKSMVENRIEVVESFISELSPALMVHTGPGTTGLCYYPVYP